MKLMYYLMLNFCFYLKNVFKDSSRSKFNNCCESFDGNICVSGGVLTFFFSKPTLHVNENIQLISLLYISNAVITFK